FELTVDPVNDPSIITGQVELITVEDTPLVITLDNLLVTDVDNNYPEDFTLTVLAGDNYTVEGTTITLDSNFDEDLTVPVFVDDGEAADSLSNTFNLTVVVTPVNDAPVLADIGSQQTNEDTSLTILLSAEDVDNVDLIYSVSSESPQVSVTLDGNLLTMTPALNYNGTANITVTVSDGFLTDGETFELTVTPVN
ncbi:uncharacterized protein METZ01_LOCUS139169, partial [marine metagenome]